MGQKLLFTKDGLRDRSVFIEMGSCDIFSISIKTMGDNLLQGPVNNRVIRQSRRNRRMGLTQRVVAPKCLKMPEKGEWGPIRACCSDSNWRMESAVGSLALKNLHYLYRYIFGRRIKLPN